MKRLILLLALCLPALAQNQSAVIPASLNAAGSTCGVSNCASIVLPVGTATVGVTLTGTFSGTVQFEESADGATFVGANAAPQPSGAVVTSATSTGTWIIPAAGMQVVRARVSTYSSGTVVAFLQASIATPAAAQNSTALGNVGLNAGTNAVGTVGITNTAGSTDPCANPSVLKSSVAIAITSAATTSLVAVSGSTAVYVCGFSVTISQVVTTANTIKFEYGTGASCTSPTVLTGAYGTGGVTAAAPITVSYGAGGPTIFTAPASNGICAVTTIGASGSFEGVLTYVQQ